MLSGIGDYGSSSGEEPEEDAAPTPKVKQEPVKSEHGGSAIAPTVKREPLIAKDGGKVQAVPAGAFSDSSSPSGSSDSSEDSDEADAGTAGRRIKEAPKMPKKRKLNLPPPDFNSTKLGSGGIYHQYREHCGCQSCEQTRWRLVHRDESLELNVIKRKEQEKEEEERKKRQWIRENLKKRGIRTDPTAMSKVQKITGIVQASHAQVISSGPANEHAEGTGSFQAENAYARAVRQKQAKEAAARSDGRR